MTSIDEILERLKENHQKILMDLKDLQANSLDAYRIAKDREDVPEDVQELLLTIAASQKTIAEAFEEKIVEELEDTTGA